MLLRCLTDSDLRRSNILTYIQKDQAYPDEETGKVFHGGETALCKGLEERKSLENCSLFRMPGPQNIKGHVVRNRTGEISGDQFMKRLVKSC